MNPLTLDLFLPAGKDVESAQYRILAKLKSVRDSFKHNSIYPHLSHLIGLHETVERLVGGIDSIREALPGTVTGIDLDNGTVIYEKQKLDDNQLAHIEELLRWALPHIQEAIEVGRTIYEFVDDNMELEEVGIVPSYVKEGYLLVPDRKLMELHVLRYEFSVLVGVQERYRSLKTTHVKTIPGGTVHIAPASVKLDLVTENRDLPNPATYHFVTQLEFPFRDTVLPVAKRKLIRYLNSQGLAA
ncbi:MAG: hypothetical protein HKN13_12070 [Rhodothermales bacterium]|nr:hypothetical protein [Rhodothermales bacterium]